MRKLVTLTVLVSALGGAAGTYTAQAENTKHKCPGVIRGIHYYRTATWNWQEKLGAVKYRAATKHFHSCAYATWAAKRWMHRAKRLHKHYANFRSRVLASGSLTSDWSCIHSHEGSWSANTGNGYYGGLQMDLSFQQAYGAEFLSRWGTADHWPVWAQVTAANRAKRSNGYTPWPNTARMCGLL